MPRAGFYNDNEYRAYPFVFKREYVGGSRLPRESIVDCGFIMGIDSGYAPDTDVIYLHSITRNNSSFQFVFKTTAIGAADYAITFSVNDSEEEWQTIFDESAVNTDNNFCAEEPAWEGFIVIGKLDELKTELTENETIVFYAPNSVTAADTPDYVIEPSRVQSLVRAYLRSIGVANYERPRVPSCAELSSSSSSNANPQNRQIIVNSSCIKGDIKIKAGYNCAINQNTTANVITVQTFKRDGGTADSNAEICQYGSELPLYPGHEPPEDSVFLSGGPACDDLITSINGVSGDNITISAEAGIQIVSEADNSIKIDVATNIIQQNCG